MWKEGKKTRGKRDTVQFQVLGPQECQNQKGAKPADRGWLVISMGAQGLLLCDLHGARALDRDCCLLDSDHSPLNTITVSKL